jgi:hypothetical protein
MMSGKIIWLEAPYVGDERRLEPRIVVNGEHVMTALDKWGCPALEAGEQVQDLHRREPFREPIVSRNGTR